MPILQLIHLKKLGYASTQKLQYINDHWLKQGGSLLLITFRPIRKGVIYEKVNNVHGCKRICDRVGEHDVLAHSLETDSPLAPQILWDIAHTLKIGKTITLVEDNSRTCFLEREYYKYALKLESETLDSKTFRKVAKLPAENDVGLNEWTFGIPVGPEDATILNAVVMRILELDIPKKEILLCGRPGENFHYFDKVRIVGEDITAPPVKICTKKNRLAEEATYANLCILHDRVFLPSNFINALENYGDIYPVSSFQSLYFDDKNNAVPRRYSDYGVCPKLDYQFIKGFKCSAGIKLTKFNTTTLSSFEELGFYSAHPLRYSSNNYITGSLYICKKSVWLSCPQNENILWAEFEDVEHGKRMYETGIPSRIILNGFTQSIIGRSILSQSGAVQSEFTNGRIGNFRSLLEPVPSIRKPLIKLTPEKALDLLNKFIEKYVPESYCSQLGDISVSSDARLESLIRVIYSCRISIRHNAVEEYLKDFEKCLMLDQLSFKWKSHMVEIFVDHKHYIKEYLINNFGLLNQITQRPDQGTFSNNNAQYFVKNSILKLRCGTLFSAFNLWLTGNSLYLQGGVIKYYRAIMNSTPFEKYLDK